MEELAKAHMLEDMVWHTMTDKAPLDFSWEGVRKSLYSHRTKQEIFSSHLYMTMLIANNGKIPGNRFYDFIQSGRLEILKQKALYVGLSPITSPSQKLKIEDPLILQISASKENITILNDYLLDIIVGVVHEFYAFDAKSIKNQVNESLLNRLMQGWPYNGRIGKRAIKIHTEMIAN